MKKVFIFVALIIIFTGIIFSYFYYSQKQTNFFNINAGDVELSPQAKECGAGDSAIATKVIDGDTIIVEGGYHIRLLGIDADEKDYPCYDAAKNRLEELVSGRQVELKRDKTDTDKYGRCLRTIFIGGENINLELVKEGLAVARFYEPDTKYKNEIITAEKQAIAGSVGCKWQK